jgi:UDP-glucuronate decarboxylase
VHYQFDPVQTTKTSISGALNMLGLAKRVKAKVLQASTSEVYGDPEVHPQTEDYRGSVNPLGPRACYDEGKRCAETLFFDYFRQHNVRIKVARIFNTYGPRHASAGRARGVELHRPGAAGPAGDDLWRGHADRSFCFVDDLVEGLMRLMATPDDITGPVNLGNPHEITVRELAERVIALCGEGVQLEKRPLPQDDPTRRCPDIGLAKQLLGWEPLVPLEDGLRRTVAYFDALLRRPVDSAV